MSEGLVVFLGALAIDLLMGEPPKFCHPVVWIGWLIDGLKNLGKTRLYGALLAFTVISVSAGLAMILLLGSFRISNVIGLILSAFLLKTTFSITMLTDTAWKVESLVTKNLKYARFELQALVGRDRSKLNHYEIRSAIIESISENFLDGFLSPLFYFTLGLSLNILWGIFFAIIYKSINTLDSMVGYKTSELQDIGYLSAKLDDILNYLPARLSFFIISVASTSMNAFRIGIRDHALPSSPNAGWPMAAIAGALKVNLCKPDNYSLGSEYALPQQKHVKQGIIIIKISTAIMLLIYGGIIWAI